MYAEENDGVDIIAATLAKRWDMAWMNDVVEVKDGRFLVYGCEKYGS
jgi:hypothetical protein